MGNICDCVRSTDKEGVWTAESPKMSGIGHERRNPQLCATFQILFFSSVAIAFITYILYLSQPYHSNLNDPSTPNLNQPNPPNSNHINPSQLNPPNSNKPMGQILAAVRRKRKPREPKNNSDGVHKRLRQNRQNPSNLNGPNPTGPYEPNPPNSNQPNPPKLPNSNPSNSIGRIPTRSATLGRKRKQSSELNNRFRFAKRKRQDRPIDDGFQFTLDLKTPNDQTFTNASPLAQRYLACQYRQFNKYGGRWCGADYDSAMKSLVKERRKIKHWIWYIIPTPPLLDKNGKITGSSTNQHFALKGDDEIKDFVANDLLKGNYIQAIKLIRDLVKFRLTQKVSTSRYDAVDFVTGRNGDNRKLLSSLKIFQHTLDTEDRDYNDAVSYLLQCFGSYNSNLLYT
eukprot:728021_1